MFRALVTWIANSLAILIVSAYVHGMQVASVRDAFAAGALFSVLIVFVRPVLVVLTLPLTVLTLGLFYFLITAFCLWLTQHWIAGFSIRTVPLTIVCSVLVSLVSLVIRTALNRLAGPDRS
jgi:putative membrane protein